MKIIKKKKIKIKIRNKKKNIEKKDNKGCILF